MDGKQYGPYLHQHRERFGYLSNRVGVEIKPVWLTGGWVDPTQKAPPRSKKDKTMPLLEGLGFVPVPRQSRPWNTPKQK